MFSNWKKKAIIFIWSRFPRMEKVSLVFDKIQDFFEHSCVVLRYFVNYLVSLVSIILPLFQFLMDIWHFVLRKVAYIWLFLTKYRLLYVVRLIFILLVLYKPVLIDLDSFYWLASIVFYFISNTIFFIWGNIVPLTSWFHKTWGYNFFVIGSLIPAIWIARRFKRRVYRRYKLLLLDEDILFSFYWIQQMFVLSLYYLLFFTLFLFLTILLPIVYVYISEFDFIFITRLFYNYYLSSYLILMISILPTATYTYVSSFFSTLSCAFFYFYMFFVVLVFKNLCFCFTFLLCLTKSLCIYTCVIILSFASSNLTFLVDFFLGLGSSALIFTKWFCYTLSWKNFYVIIDVFKNFLFSDNYLHLIFLILGNVAKTVFVTLTHGVLFFIKSFLLLFLDESILNSLTLSFNTYKNYLLIYFYNKLIVLLDCVIYYENIYFKDLTFFGIISTWYGYLNHSAQRAASEYSFINWLLIHLYASILAFWILDFDFRVSVKTPPKTPYTLFKEARETYDWIPLDMDLNALQTNHTKLYFALLDISFEHIESLQFIYGDFEHIDEEWDEEDETPDEEEFWVDSDETVQVREIIDTDLETTKLKHHWTRSEVIRLNPVSTFSGYERHFLSEIVGEPELVNIEEELKWAYEPLYSPSFQELHYKDSLFSEWIFDPDEDLTLFEVLLLVPIVLFFIYIWLYHRPAKRRHDHRRYYKAMIATRRRIFSGFFVEEFLGLPLGDYGRRMMDAYRRLKSPEIRIKNWYRNKLAKRRYKLKLLQLEAYFFEKLRLKLYRKVLKRWENNYNISVEFLAPRRHFPQFYTGIKNLKIEMRNWIRFGDWIKFDLYSATRSFRNRFLIWEDLQVALPELFDEFMLKKRKRRKMRKRLWRTLAALPGHITMARVPKVWDERFFNKDLFYPDTYKRMRYNYNYYNYIGWRKNRAQWRRYAFTPVQTSNDIWAYHRGVSWKTYSFLKRQQSKHRLIRSIQF